MNAHPYIMKTKTTSEAIMLNALLMSERVYETEQNLGILLDIIHNLIYSSQAANYLDIKGLLDVTCKTVANNIKGKTLGEIQHMFNIKNDCTSQEQKASTSSTTAMGVLSCSRTFNEFPDGDLYSIFKCMLAVTNDLAVLYALAQVFNKSPEAVYKSIHT